LSSWRKKWWDVISFRNSVVNFESLDLLWRVFLVSIGGGASPASTHPAWG
jgi:hypothetical protein